MTPREARMASDFELQQAAEMGDEFAYLELQDRIIYWEGDFQVRHDSFRTGSE